METHQKILWSVSLSLKEQKPFQSMFGVASVKYASLGIIWIARQQTTKSTWQSVTHSTPCGFSGKKSTPKKQLRKKLKNHHHLPLLQCNSLSPIVWMANFWLIMIPNPQNGYLSLPHWLLWLFLLDFLFTLSKTQPFDGSWDYWTQDIPHHIKLLWRMPLTGSLTMQKAKFLHKFPKSFPIHFL